VALRYFPVIGITGSTLLLAMGQGFFVSLLPFAISLIAESPELSRKFARMIARTIEDRYGDGDEDSGKQ